ncbi:DegT/DnrJ/EryC1/StrS aminotransferase family protein [Candidatus Gottesmanbacteria bacterium]|nr:DegT/DnrJ/EryC1/StrS aminotransferase family protein [Candidatus Gottesmanbacteria bacterium]
MILKAPIAIGLSPNTENDDVWQAIKIIFQPWMWQEGDAIKKVLEWFKNYFNFDEAFLFNSGRSALYVVLKSFGIDKGDEVLVQAFTCVAVPDPVIWTGAKPIFVDIDETLNIDPGLLEKHINRKTKVIIVQHTFGIPAQIELIKKIAQKYNLILIEDCAHSLGAEVYGKKVGTFGDAVIFSFGRDKVISSVFGGMASINSKFKTQCLQLKKLQGNLNFPGYFWILQQLLHPIFFVIILPLYNLIVGKLFLAILIKLRILTKPIFKEEMNGFKPDVFPAKYPNALAVLLLNQLTKLQHYNNIRIKLASYYFDKLKETKNIILPVQVDGGIYLRFNIQLPNSEEILLTAKKQGILLGNWYKNIVDPKYVDYKKIGYYLDSCPKAELSAKSSVNLPTYPKLSISDLEKIVKLLT